ncbi:sensor histidine kinase [Frondihabitans peucedani]|uniref:histidine kinase n=1 Tax=Frondihabitans peucedani TaxID=598626 RepID=A0ABP8E2A3_9MICO
MTPAFPDAPERTGLGSTLNGVGAVVVGSFLVVDRVGAADGRLPAGVLVLGLVALAAWIVRSFLRPGRVADAAAVVMLVVGSALVTSTDALLITPAIVAIVAVAADLRHPRGVVVAFAATGFAIVTATSLLDSRSPSFLLACLGGLALGCVVGYNRRQNRVAEVTARKLLAREVEIEREQQHSALLADRARVARDIHDVLAHSLGGLVIQLDAVEALLENGRTDEAAARVTAARSLAADGLGEARRAVATLRDPALAAPAGGDPLDRPDAVDRLLETHRSLGGQVSASGLDALTALDAEHSRALAGVLREALSNARRHAPGAPVAVAATADAGRGTLRVTVSNPVGAGAGVAGATAGPAAAGPGAEDRAGGGQGLPGMRDRLAELGDGSRVAAGRRGDSFVVEAEVVVR